MKSKSGKTKAKKVALKGLKPRKGAAIKGGGSKLEIRGGTQGC